jgi:hypothetical protein
MTLLDKVKNYFNRKTDLRVLFIFDNGIQCYEQELPPIGDSRWPADFIYEVYDNRAFRIKYNLEHEWKEKKVVLLVKSAPPQDEKSRLSFPLLDILVSNMEFKEDSAELFMQERGIKHDFIEYVKRNVTKLQRKKNDDLLKDLYNEITTDMLNRSIISADMDSSKLLSWTDIFLKLIVWGREENSKKREKFFKAALQSKDAIETMQKMACKIFGYKTVSYDLFNPVSMIQFIAKSLKYNSLCGNLSLVVGDNYEQFKISNSLESINAIWDAGMSDEALKNALKELASDIDEKYILKLYGAEADYFRLTPELAYPIAESLLEKRLWVAPAEVNEKIRFWLSKSNDEQVQTTFNFLSKLCDFYATKSSFKMAKLNTPDDYVNAYTSEYYQLDLSFRLAIEFYANLNQVNSAIESFEKAKKRLADDYAKFTGELNRNWVESLKRAGNDIHKLGFTNQEDFYEKYQKNGSKLVVIVSDAFRYELGAELKQELLKKAKLRPQLEFALAQLPTETKYCKTALLPHRTLEFVESDIPSLAVDGVILNSLELREKQLQKYVEKAKCVNFTDLDNLNYNQKKELFKSPLVYVFHDFVDDSGHDHNAKILTKACRESINDLKKFIYYLHSSMYVTNVIVTADHGFLYDCDIAEKDKQQIAEESLEKKTRYYLTKSSVNIPLTSKYSLSKVSGMNREDVFVAVPFGINRMAASGGYNFAHGGVSLQEIIIPVVISSYTHEDEKQKVSLTLLDDSRLKMTSSILKIKVLQKEAISKEFKERTVECAIFDGDVQVTKVQRIILNCIDADNLAARINEISLALNKPTNSNSLELRIWDIDDKINPLYKKSVTNNTLIEPEF